MSTFSRATNIHPVELEERTVGRAVRRGVVYGVPSIYLLILVVALLGGAGFWVAASVAVVPAFVAGPYFGTLLVLSRVEEERHMAEVATLVTPASDETSVSHAA